MITHLGQKVAIRVNLAITFGYIQGGREREGGYGSTIEKTSIVSCGSFGTLYMHYVLLFTKITFSFLLGLGSLNYVMSPRCPTSGQQLLFCMHLHFV